MRLPRIQEWGYSGSPEDGRGVITYARIPLHWWLLHQWLSHAHPHWALWYRGWGRILPYWGDPFCAAYTIVWFQFYSSREEDRAWIEVGWDRLPEAVKAQILAWTDEDDDRPRGRASQRPA